MTPRLLVWLFPFLMVIFDYLLRSGLQDPEDLSFVGPTPGAAAMGMLLPLTRLAEISRGRSGRSNVFQLQSDARAERLATTATITLWLGLAF